MKRAALLGWTALWAPLAYSGPVDLRQRTDAGQFAIYCSDVTVRREAASLALRTRDDLAALLADSEGGRRPVVVTIDFERPAGVSPVTVRPVQTEVGLRVEIAAHAGGEPGEINLQRQLTGALLLEYMYRHSGLPDGTAFVEPPWWLFEGVAEMLRRRESGPDGDFFRQLVETNKLPPIEGFLARRPDELGGTALAVDRALAMCLVQLLLDQPSGRAHLAAFLRHWPAMESNPVAGLAHEFGALGGGAATLQKWWTLNLARLAAVDRLQGLSVEQTDREVRALLQFEVPLKEGGARHFQVGDFAEYRRLPASRAAVKGQRAALLALGSRANAMLRPVIVEYADLLERLGRGKTGGLALRLQSAQALHAAVLRRAAEIADYLNWFEATQMQTRSTAFDSYLKTAAEVSENSRRREGPVSEYLDALEKE